MKRFKKAICLLLIFSLTFSLFVIPASASPIAIVGSIVAIAGAFVTLDAFIDESIEHTDRFLSLFDGGLITDIEVGEGETVAGYVFKAYNTNRNWLTGNSVQVSFESLSDLTLTLNSYGISCTLKTQSIIFNNSRMTVWVIIPHDQLIVDTAYGVAGFYQGPVLLANQSGYPYYAAASTDNTTSTNTNYNYYTQEGGDSSTTNNEYNYTTGDTVNNPIFKYGDEITENNQVYDYSSDSYVEVGDITYDASTKQYTTNITIDNSVHVQYNIDHTSITYIGSSAEDKTYNLYYELPDGRNSSELTAEDLEQLVLNYNVINYGVSADDGRLRALYHFDGDLEDSSYWSKYSKFDWVSGASLTYLESNSFGGCLYLDEGAHQFDIYLPSNLSSGDFSVFFRYYHSATTNTGTDMILKAGSTNLTAIAYGAVTVPVGTWNEFGFVMDGGHRYIYLNGVCFYDSDFTGNFANVLSFVFSSGASYRYFDELRVYNFAFIEAGADYTPTAVPVDTNAVLILPDQAAPIPDAYWEFDTDGNTLSYNSFTDGITNPFIGNGSAGGPSANYIFWTNIRYSPSGHIYLPSSYAPLIKPDFVTMNGVSNLYSAFGIFDTQQSASAGAPVIYNPYPCVPIATGTQSGSGSINWTSVIPLDTQCLYTVLDMSGTPYSIPVKVNSNGGYYSQTSTFENLTLFTKNGSYVLNGVTYYFTGLYIIPKPSTTFSFIYQEIVPGTTPNEHKYVTEIYFDIDLTMPTVAIRSQIPIREYRIGGVRPTVPYRGDVWMMVENSHITSVQIYTGFAWQEVDLRIWTGQRWVSALYYNIMTQQDYTDILGTTDNEYIQSTEGFYSWLTKQFKELLAVLNEISDQIEEIDSGSGASLDFTFEIDGSTTVEFTKLSDDARNGLLRVAVPLYDILFSEAGTIYEGVLGDFALLFDLDNSTVTVEDEETYSIWFIFNADQEVWNVRSIR